MNEPVIEVRHRCEHGILDPHEYTYNRLECKGGQRVRCSRQEAIDLIAKSYPVWHAKQAISVLLGASE